MYNKFFNSFTVCSFLRIKVIMGLLQKIQKIGESKKKVCNLIYIISLLCVHLNGFIYFLALLSTVVGVGQLCHSVSVVSPCQCQGLPTDSGSLSAGE